MIDFAPALLLDHGRRRIADEPLIGQLAPGLFQSLLFALQLFFQPRAFFRNIDQPGQRNQQAHVAGELDSAVGGVAIVAGVLDGFQPRQPPNQGIEALEARAIVVVGALDQQRHRFAGREVQLGARRSNRQNYRLQPFGVGFGIGVARRRRRPCRLCEEFGVDLQRRLQSLPDFLGDERHERMQQPQHRIQDFGQRPACRGANRRVGVVGQRRLGQLQIPIAELVPDEFVDCA